MCMRMSSDGGRNFLSTSEPARSDNQRAAAQAGAKENDEKKDRAVTMSDILEQFFPGRRGE